MAANQQDPDDESTPDVAADTRSQIAYMQKERVRVIQHLAFQSGKVKAVLDPTVEPHKPFFRRLDMFIRWLDQELQMTPHIRRESKIEDGLKLMFAHERFHFAPSYVEKATALIKRWEAGNWGGEVKDEPLIKDEEEQREAFDAELQQPPLKRARPKAAGNGDRELASLRLPPPSHPIFGTKGIMHGCAYPHGRKAPHLDPRYPKVNANVYGHNGLEMGAWFPFRIIALFRGAHGAMQAGISGNRETGAYAIVVSGQYEALDRDRGDVLHYSGSNSHDNEDPNSPPPSTSGTLALHASRASGNPVRVLRAASGKSAWAPTEGLRYDGLYRVVSVREPTNLKKGKYEQFKLVRMADQRAIDISRPTVAEQRDFDRIRDDY